MTTTSANIAGVIKPFGGVIRRFSPGYMYDIDEMTPTGSRKRRLNKNKGVYEVLTVDGKVMIEAKKEKKYRINGKVGVWRTIKGRHYFFPEDGSGVIPPFPG